MNSHFVCGACGSRPAGLPTDIAYGLPDVVWALPEEERNVRAKLSSDLCLFEGRHFIRGILRVPFVDQEGDFAWGVWVEVERPVFERYLELYDEDGQGEPAYQAALANSLVAYTNTCGIPAEIRFGGRTQRPSVHLASSHQSQLAADQREGIDGTRYHEILRAAGLTDVPIGDVKTSQA